MELQKQLHEQEDSIRQLTDNASQLSQQVEELEQQCETKTETIKSLESENDVIPPRSIFLFFFPYFAIYAGFFLWFRCGKSPSLHLLSLGKPQVAAGQNH